MSCLMPAAVCLTTAPGAELRSPATVQAAHLALQHPNSALCMTSTALPTQAAVTPTPQWTAPQVKALPPQDMSLLTNGLPNPQEIDEQKNGYIKILQEQHRQYKHDLDSQRMKHLDYIYSQAEQEKTAFLQKLQKQVEEKKIAIEKQLGEQMMLLDQQFLQQCAELEQQAIKITGEYLQKQLNEEGMRRMNQIQKERSEVEKKFAIGMQLLSQQPAPNPVQTSVPLAQSAQVASYVAPIAFPMGSHHSYTPPPVAHISCAAPQQTSSYVPPPVTSTAMIGSYTPPVVITMPALQQPASAPPMALQPEACAHDAQQVLVQPQPRPKVTGRASKSGSC